MKRDSSRHGGVLAAILAAGLLTALPAAWRASARPAPAADSLPARQTDEPPPTAPAAPAAERADDLPPPSWREVERLVDDGLPAAALGEVERVLDAARRRGDEEEWTRALIEAAKLELILGELVNGVARLREPPQPEGARQRMVLDLAYAEALFAYLQAYRWEIGRRERVSAGPEVDLRSWTTEQIVAETRRALFRAWEGREVWGAEPVTSLGRYLEPGSYPAGLRDTLRDAVSYRWAELLADTALWSPAEHDGLDRLGQLELAALIAGEEPSGQALADPAIHPLRRLAAVLGDLERWHREAGRPEAAFEALRVRLDKLHGRFEDEEERVPIRAALERALAALGRDLPWWSMGMATLASMTRQSPAPDALAKAHAIALEGGASDPESIGGRQCRRLAAAIEEPEFSLQAMAADGAGRRSILVTHKNLPRLYFEAWRLDLSRQIETDREGWVLPEEGDAPEIHERPPDVRWEVPLPPTPDYRLHGTYVTPQIQRVGLWVVLASTAEKRGGSGTQVAAVNLLITDLVILSRQRPEAFGVTVRAGVGGEALPGIEVALYRWDSEAGHRPVATAITGDDGTVLFPFPDSGDDDDTTYFPLARRGEDETVLLAALEPQRGDEPEEPAALVYTDRSVYRPRQGVLWKVVAYGGDRAAGRFAVLTDRSLRVDLVDPRGQRVAGEDVTTNDYGSASGRFTVPAGRPLGEWTVEVRDAAEEGGPVRGHAAVRVEEYKRPTFEVTIPAPPAPAALGREARFTGEARYFFGLPVGEGRVRWTVVREPHYSYWTEWWREPPPSRRRVVASGVAELTADGVFEVAFTPETDPRASGSALCFRFRLEVEVTDPGGETRSASRAFLLGPVAVWARVDGERGFWDAGRPIGIAVLRTDLDGTARPGRGSWRLVALDAPERTLLPAEMPQPPRYDASEGYSTPGDLLTPRWSPGYDPRRALALWPDGEQVAAGRAEHGDDGTARLALPALAPGAYRLHYRTEDEAGEVFETRYDLVVVADGATPLPLPTVLLVDRDTVARGGVARVFVQSGLAGLAMVLERLRGGEAVDRHTFAGGAGGRIVEIPVDEDERGGFGLRLTALADYQFMQFRRNVAVPWDDRELKIEFSTFRDLLRPGQGETWRVTVRSDDGAVAVGAAELLAYMYDRSLDLFAPHRPPEPLGLYPTYTGVRPVDVSLGWTTDWSSGGRYELPEVPRLREQRWRFFDGYRIGRYARSRVYSRPPSEGMQEELVVVSSAPIVWTTSATMGSTAVTAALAPGADNSVEPPGSGFSEPVELRSDFAETAFWEPHLVLGEGGEVGFEFTVPEAVTEWSVWVHALTRDLRAGSVERRTRTVKELLVRPYVPRFLREGDRAELRVVVNNSGEERLSGTVEVRAVDPESGEDRSAELGLGEGGEERPFTAEPDGGATVTVPLTAPRRVGAYALEVTARAGGLSDGERRPLPVLPGRVHLAQSRFAALRAADRRVLAFPDLAAQAGADADATLITDRLIVTLDGQLFYGVLSALPYLIEYPYECTEQTLNRFVSTAIVSSVFERYPAVAAMAKELAERETRYEAFDEPDPNRDLLLEETPWLRLAQGGTGSSAGPPEALIKALEPEIAAAQRDAALASLAEAQTASGGFPWWPGGPPSPYLTLYILEGLSRALERGAEVPAVLTAPAWRYLHDWWVDKWWSAEVVAAREAGPVAAEEGQVCCIETLLNYVLSSYPETGEWTGGAFLPEDRAFMLEQSFRHWRQHPPRLKVYLALTLARAGRGADAMTVFDSVMDSARTDRDLGTYWAPEERAWLWYNDTVETHALALAALTELAPDDPRRDGLVQWLFLNRKLNHWKSTRATAEAIWALVESLEQDGALGAAEAARVIAGPIERSFRFEPDEYSGKGNQVVIPGPEVDPATMSEITVEKETPGLLFASATWHFSTERLPEEPAEGGLFTVRRSYFRRFEQGGEWVLRPLAEGERLAVGDQVEVQLSITARHAAEYVHLRDPRGAGFEPETLTSGYRWELGLARYEEVRDSGTNFFIEWLPAGEYTLKHRLRAATAGTFRARPATLQSMYAPEFTAYSSGAELAVEGE